MREVHGLYAIFAGTLSLMDFSWAFIVWWQYFGENAKQPRGVFAFPG